MNKLRENLPDSCYQAVEQAVKNGIPREDLDDSLYQIYFSSQPTPPLNEQEQKELFEQLGNRWVKNHYSTAELRRLIDTEPTQKRGRKHE